MDRPIGSTPICTQPNNYTPTLKEQLDPKEPRATTDSDYAGDTTHQKSVTGFMIKLGGGAIYYKT